MTSCKPPPTCIDASPIPDANDSRMSAIPYEANLTPMGDHSPHDGAKLPFDLAVTIPRDRLRPQYGDGFLGAPLLLCRPSKMQWPDHGGADVAAQDKSPNPQGPGEP